MLLFFYLLVFSLLLAPRALAYWSILVSSNFCGMLDTFDVLDISYAMPAVVFYTTQILIFFLTLHHHF